MDLHPIRYLILVTLSCSFLNSTAAAQQTTVYIEAFHTTEPPDLPLGWIAEGNWATSSSVPSSGSGGNNLVHQSGAGFALTPAIDLSDITDARLSYFARRTGTYEQNNLIVRASGDGGVTFPHVLLDTVDALPSSAATYELMAGDLPEELWGRSSVILQFEVGTTGGNLRIDDVTISGNGPVLEASTLELPFNVPPGEAQQRLLSIKNAGTSDLNLGNPEIEGAVYSISPATGSILPPGESRDYVVNYEPDHEAAFAGTVRFVHSGPGSPTEIILSGMTTGSRLGFREATSTAQADGSLINIPVVLEYADDTPLQGVQFELILDDQTVTLADVLPGEIVSDEGIWQISHHAAGPVVRVLVITTETGGLPLGSYDPLLVLQLDVSTDHANTDVAIANVLGAYAEPTGGNADIGPGTDTHALTIVSGTTPDPQFSADNLNFGAVIAGETGIIELEVINSEPGSILTIDSVYATSELVTISPPGATIWPAEPETFSVTFSPLRERFGLEDGEVVFVYEGGVSEAVIPVQALGIHGRGDADGDGIVDVMDLVAGIDFVTGAGNPDKIQRSTLDLHPFPQGNDTLDVRDLSILVHGIVNGVWPDGHTLPVLYDPADLMEKRQATTRHVELIMTLHPDATTFRLVNESPIRAFQMQAMTAGASEIVRESGIPADATLRAALRDNEETASLVLFRFDGGTVEPGDYLLATIPVHNAGGETSIRYITAVDGDGKRIPVAVRQETATSLWEGGPVPVRFELGTPYPNPFRLSDRDIVSIPFALPEPARVEMGVYDVLGRKISVLIDGEEPSGNRLFEWDGRDRTGDRVSPGVYVIRKVSDYSTMSQKLIVLP